MPTAAEVAEALRRGGFAPVTIRGSVDAAVVDLTHDSRAAGPAVGFACVRGVAVDGHDFAPAAVAAGAPLLLVERPVAPAVTQIEVSDVRAALGPAAAAVHGRPSSAVPVVGVTGTNGKTTVTHLIADLLGSAGRRPAVLGTLSGPRTTPEGTDLQRRLAELVTDGHDAVAMEVSSHALALHRVDGTRFAVAAFTNLSPEHLDFHADLDDYFAAKARLFEAGRAAVAVLPVDDPWGARLAARATIPVVPWRVGDATGVRTGPTGTRFRWRGHDVLLPLPGRFNLANAMTAAAVASVLGLDDATVSDGLHRVRPVRGRFEPVEAGQPFTLLVDYAHTPDALEQALGAARDLVGPGGRLLVVFGCGGDRDAGKRPRMGAVAVAGADAVIVTSDNPRAEDPAAIAADVLAGTGGAPTVTVELDRAAAIAAAVDGADPGDVVLVAGKGHETTQTTGDHVRPFDDRAVAAALLRDRAW